MSCKSKYMKTTKSVVKAFIIIITIVYGLFPTKFVLFCIWTNHFCWALPMINYQLVVTTVLIDSLHFPQSKTVMTLGHPLVQILCLPSGIKSTKDGGWVRQLWQSTVLDRWSHVCILLGNLLWDFHRTTEVLTRELWEDVKAIPSLFGPSWSLSEKGKIHQFSQMTATCSSSISLPERIARKEGWSVSPT
jgi:hypothetical protein